MNAELMAGASRMHSLEWTRAGEPMAGTFQLRKEQWDDEIGQHYERYVFRTTHWTPNAPDVLVANPSPIFYAVRGGFEETVRVIKFIGVGLVRLVQGRVSLATVSGPITIYDVAGQAGARGATYFIWAMALISVNLGLINLLPIPVLDGGHLFFFLIEAIRRRPISLRVREVASLVGVSVLVVLMLIAFKNDVERRWDVIRGQIHEVTHEMSHEIFG
jgi:regulator of sigma E protease